MTVVTEASGQLGRAVIEGLRSRLPADRIVASIRDPEKATALAEWGVHVRAGDFAEPGGLATAFAGAEQVLGVSVSSLPKPSGSRTRTVGLEERIVVPMSVVHQSGMALGAGVLNPAPRACLDQAASLDPNKCWQKQRLDRGRCIYLHRTRSSAAR